MNNSERRALVALPVIILVGIGVALAGSTRGAKLGALPLFALAVGLIFAIQWAAFAIAFLLKTERFYDLTGSATYISVAILALLLSPAPDGRSFLLAALVLIWAGRLGTFLFLRVLRAGKDARFDEIKVSFLRFLQAWTLQALWITLTAGAAYAAITSGARIPLGATGLVGLLVWLIGFGVEALADAQKNRFRADPANRGQFIRTGLWAWSRHPNYFGEIVLWIGVALIALPALEGWQMVTLVSPLFVALLLTRVSGVPLLEQRSDVKWGGLEAYEAYKARTSVLIPRPPLKSQ